MFIVLILSLAIGYNTDDDYREAFYAADAGEPMVVMLSMDGCIPCAKLEPALRKEYPEMIKLDVESSTKAQEIAVQRNGVISVPQLHIYKKVNGKWSHEAYVDFSTNENSNPRYLTPGRVKVLIQNLKNGLQK